MSSRLKLKKSRIVMVIVLILIVLSLAAFGYYEYRLQQGRLLSNSVPKPPSVLGCHEYTKNKEWHTVECLTPEQVRHIPHPQARALPLAEGGNVGLVGVAHINPVTNSPITFAQVSINMIAYPPPYFLWLGSETDSNSGPDGFSIQLNTNTYTGRNGNAYWNQFVVQSFTPLPGANTNACSGTYCFTDVFGIWQIDVTVACNTPPGCGNPQGYSCTCIFITPQTLTATYIGLVQGFVEPVAGTSYGNLVSVALLGDGTIYSVVARDYYGLSALGHWQQASGTILGAGGGSQAQFTTPTAVHTTLATTFAGPVLLEHTYTDKTTAESNNLAYLGSPQMTISGCCTVNVSTFSIV